MIRSLKIQKDKTIDRTKFRGDTVHNCNITKERATYNSHQFLLILNYFIQAKSPLPNPYHRSTTNSLISLNNKTPSRSWAAIINCKHNGLFYPRSKKRERNRQGQKDGGNNITWYITWLSQRHNLSCCVNIFWGCKISILYVYSSTFKMWLDCTCWDVSEGWWGRGWMNDRHYCHTPDFQQVSLEIRTSCLFPIHCYQGQNSAYYGKAI